MILAITEIGIIPFFRSPVDGWSVEDLTDPDWWFYTSDNLGPWDWKIDVVREGDIAYGKFLSKKAAFATLEWYRHLMNWRRSLAQHTVAGAKTESGRLPELLSPVVLDTIRQYGALESSELRAICGIKKNVMDAVLQYLDMGTWTIIGDFRRVYRGPNLTYSGWQRSTITTPDALFGTASSCSTRDSGELITGHRQELSSDRRTEEPFWARFIEDNTTDPTETNCSPEESRQLIIEHLTKLYPGNEARFNKII